MISIGQRQNHVTSSVHRILRAAAALAAAAAPVAAPAQDSARLEEIIVTAQRREQNIQNVPIAISAFTAETLRGRGVTDVTSLSNLAPNVNLDASSPFSGDTSVLSASIRGIGSDDFAFNIDPGVGVYLDGVFLARTFGANQNLLDVERVEILRGPQGTLFGRNTIGGAINIVTHDPGPEANFEAQATVGSYERMDVGFTADLPITDSLFSSLTVSSIDREGYQDVIPYPAGTLLGNTPFIVDPMNAYPRAGFATSDAKGGFNQTVVRGKLKWLPSDDVKVTFAADYQNQDQPSTPTTILSVNTNFPANIFGAIYNACISTPADVLNAGGGFLGPVMNTGEWGLCGPRAQMTPELGGTGGAALGGAGYVGGPGGNLLLSDTPRIYWNFANTQTGNIDTTYANGVSFAKNDGWGLAATAEWQIGEDLLFKSITAYREIDWRVGIDLDGTPESIQEVTDHQEQEQWSQEFQLLGTLFDDRLDYVFGLYYFTEEGFVHDFVPFQGLLYVYDYQNDVDTESYAAFLHADLLGHREVLRDRRRPLHLGGQAVHRRSGRPERLQLPDLGLQPAGRSGSLHLDPSIPPCHLPHGAWVPRGRPAVPVLPRGTAETGLQRLHPDPRAAVQLQRRPDGVRQVLGGLQVRRLDDASLGPESGRRRRVQAGIRGLLRGRSEGGAARRSPGRQHGDLLHRLPGHPAQRAGGAFANPEKRRKCDIAGYRGRSTGGPCRRLRLLLRGAATSMPSTTTSIRP